MFHRVKSEVREPEQKSQVKPEKTYNSRGRDENSQTTSSRSERDTVKEEQPLERKYGQSQSKTQATQEDKTIMRTKEADNVQGKYAREPSERETENPRSYTPSVSRSGYGTSSYGASSYTPPQAPETPSYSAGDRTLTIGRGINLSGEIDACDHLLVEGTVEAALKGSKVLDVAESGTFYGTVEIEEATIAGRFEGDITVNGRLTVKSSGVITGSIAYRELEVEAGAMVDGRMTPIKGNVDPKAIDKYRAGTEASAMAKTKEVPSKKDDREAANSESGLFSKTHANY